MYNEQENFGLHYIVGYGPKYDCEVIDADFCCDCFDKIIDWIKPQCKYSIVKDE